MTTRLPKRYSKTTKKSAPLNVKKSPKAVQYKVNRFLLRVKMLEKGIETFAELNRQLGYADGSKANITRLVKGYQWRPKLVRKIEDYLGVKRGEIFRKDIPLNPPSPRGNWKEMENEA